MKFEIKSFDATLRDEYSTLTYLTALENQLSFKFELKEWTLIHSNLVSNLLPFLMEVANEKEYGVVLVKAIEIFTNNVIDGLTVNHWMSFYKLGNVRHKKKLKMKLIIIQ